MVVVGIFAAVPVLIVLIVFTYCWWLVRFTGKAESMREVVPVLGGLCDLVRLGRTRKNPATRIIRGGVPGRSRERGASGADGPPSRQRATS